MRKIAVTKRFTFEAAHFLTDYAGDCSRLHGHTYMLEVTMSSKDLVDDMVIDFKTLKEMVQKYIIDKVDHQLLNDVLPFRTTAENMAKWMFSELEHTKAISVGYFSLEKIRLWETRDSYAEVYDE